MAEKITIIRPTSRYSLVDLREVWEYQELLYILTWRDLKSRYRQTLLGILWVVFQPLTAMVIFSVFFGSLAKIPSGDLPYTLFVFCGLAYWNFFSASLTHGSDSMVAHTDIIKKVYFPKILLPLSKVIISSVDFLINMILLFSLAFIMGFIPKFQWLFLLPLTYLLTFITAFGGSMLLSSINVKYRDVRYVLPFFIQMLMFVTPVIYPLAIVSDRNRFLMALNPVSMAVESTRFIFSSGYSLHPDLMLVSLISAVIIMLIGLWYLRRTEKYFADLL